MSFYEEQAANKRMTYALFAVFFVFLVVLGVLFSYIMDNYFISIAFFFFALIYMLVSYFYSGRIVAAISGAKPADPMRHKQFINVVEEMALASGMPVPKPYVIDDTAMNAFAAGRDPEHSIICATTGLIAKMNRAELTGVVAHEMSHIRNRDVLVMTMTSVLVGIAVLMSDFMLRMFLWGGVGSNRREGGGVAVVAIVVGLLLAILTPFIAQAIKFAISRKREYLADASGAQLTRYPEGLASALEKIKGDSEVLEAANKATAHLYIANPLKGQKLWFKGMFATHPPIDDRIAKLRAM